MIKLDLPTKPTQLTPKLQAEKTHEFKTTGKAVWKIPWLQDAIFDMAFGKCCYSEIRLGEESKYMEIEHFHHKDKYQSEVMQWGNLLPSCKKCNGTKGSHDTVAEPIVNPFIDNPKDYFFLKNCFYQAKVTNKAKAKLTIKKLALNDIPHFVVPRQNIAERLKLELKDRLEDIDKFGNVLIPIGRIKRLLKQGDRHKEYSALVSTTILSDANYLAIEAYLKEKSLWDAELEALKTELEFCALPE
jgi:uncharacterized protein (TIGR02646 family)